MSGRFLSRRSVVTSASLIGLAVYGWRWIPGYSASVTGHGYGRDPDLLKRTVTWPRTLSPSHLAMLETLCDLLLPEQSPHPSAKAIGVHYFLDEWASAPYPGMQADRATLLNGLAALDHDTRRELGVAFVAADASQQRILFDRACGASDTTFPRRLIELICSGYYTTREGHAAIGYVGNVALERFPGSPPEILRHLEAALDALGHAGAAAP